MASQGRAGCWRAGYVRAAMTDSFVDSWLGVSVAAILLGTLLAYAWIWLG